MISYAGKVNSYLRHNISFRFCYFDRFIKSKYTPNPPLAQSKNRFLLPIIGINTMFSEVVLIL